MTTKKAATEDRVRRAKGKGETVALTVRLPKEDWKALRNFAMDQGESVQTIAVNAFNRELKARGYPPLKGD
jgi:hypothetical protein